MIPQQDMSAIRRTSPRRLHPNAPVPAPGPPGPPVHMHTMPQHYGNEGYGGVGGDEVRRLQDELAHKDTVLKQLEVQFELYKEEHAKLLASKIEEQREAFNLEKDRINQHFIRTGQELHTKTDEYHQQVEENERLAVENKNLKEWLDKGVDACREVAEENERLKQELMETRGAIQRSDADLARRLAQAELERDQERNEKEAAAAALQALQERVRELEIASEEDRRNFHEVTTQARRMKRRLLQLKAILDRFCGEGNADTMGAFDDSEMVAFDDMDSPDVHERQTARDALFHLHEALNGLQASCRKMTQPLGDSSDYDPNGIFTFRQQVESLNVENQNLNHKLKRKQDELASMEETLDHIKQRSDQARQEVEEELDECRRAKNQATFDADTNRNEANRLRDELEQNKISLQRIIDQEEGAQRRAQELEEDLRKLSQEMVGIRDYGLQLERQNADLERELENVRGKGGDGDGLTGQLQRQIEEQRLQYQELQDKHAALQEEVQALRQANAVLEERARGLAAQPTPMLPMNTAPPTSTPLGVTPNPTPMRMHWPTEPDDYGHASSAHVKLSCPLCATEGFIPGAPCRNCGHSVGQFTRLKPSSEPHHASAPHTPANFPSQPTHLQPPGGNPNRVSPVRWQ